MNYLTNETFDNFIISNRLCVVATIDEQVDGQKPQVEHLLEDLQNTYPDIAVGICDGNTCTKAMAVGHLTIPDIIIYKDTELVGRVPERKMEFIKDICNELDIK